MTMQALSCEKCGVGVLVEKFSPAHTSIQWESDTSECPLISRSGSAPGDHGRECSALRDSIDRAVAQRVLTESHIELPVGQKLPRLH
ncbi:hypothetical protein [Rhodococcus rhodochrous]|uniref:hypothetical protein n=1 Tax=Rhodococcus TaxID=1827 RepID=UPI00030E225D|nr:hypothetical protein [Rhodococcus rhodochrous]